MVLRGPKHVGVFMEFLAFNVREYVLEFYL